MNLKAPHFKQVFLLFFLTISFNSISQTADYKVQHLQDDVAMTGAINTSFTAVSSLNNAVALANANRKSHAGAPSSSGNAEGDDLAGARQLTGTGTLSYYREGASNNIDMRFNTSIWEYVGPIGGANEMIVRGRYAVSLNGTTNSTTQILSGISNANDCIPFITGIMNNSTGDDADSGTAIAYLENTTTLRVQKGSNGNNVTVYITVVEFTGANWTVLHGDSGDVSADTGTITIRNGSDGTGTATNVSAWSEAIIFSHHLGDTGASGTNDAIADNWPVMDPGSNDQSVDWAFNSDHDSAGTNRQFVHVLNNTGLGVTRFQNTSNSAGEVTINITSAGLTDVNQALIVGSSTSSGGGTAYGRGWRNYYFNSAAEAAHWTHRSGNTMAHELQIIDLVGLNTPVSGPEINITGLGNTIIDGDTTPAVSDDTDFGSVLTSSGSVAHTFTIENSGTSDLSVTSISMIGGASGDFTIGGISLPATITSSSSTTFTVTFDPTIDGTRTSTVSISNDDANEGTYTFDVEGVGFSPSYCTSNGSTSYNTGVTLVSFNTINNADPINNDNAYEDFTAITTTVMQSSSHNLTVNVDTDGAYTGHAYVWIDWNQDFDFDDVGEAYDLGDANSVSDGATSLSPLSITIPGTATLGTTRMRVSAKYNANPTNCETGFDGEVEDYSLNIISSAPAPEINIQGNAVDIVDGDTSPTVTDDTDFGSVATASTLDQTFTIQNTGSLTLNLTGGSPLVDISGDAAFTIVTQPSASSIANGGSDLTFVVRFAPTIGGTVQAVISIDNDDSNENPYNFTIQGKGVAPLTEGPGGVTADLELWLKGTDGLAYTDGQSVALWADQGRGADATVNTAGQEPTYRDNLTQNINFNPVVEFDNTFTSFSTDSDYSYDNTSTQFLEGADGMYTQEMFVVIIADETPLNNSFGFMDVFCGDIDIATNATDATGIGFGDYTGRVTGESICFALDTYDTGTPGDGYAVHDGTTAIYDNVGIINPRNNIGITQQELYVNGNDKETIQNDIPSFTNVSGAKYWIGRSEGWEATLNARVAEVITFSTRKDDTDLTTERNRIQSYLAVKYGITLGINGTSQDYVDSDGTVIWDQSANSGYNYDIAGIGRDDASDLNQKQSSSVNSATDGSGPIEGILTIGLTDIYNTNNENKITNSANTFNDKDFLVWGNNGADLDLAASVINVDMSAGIAGLTTPVTFTGMQRIWKVVENGSDIGSAKVSIPQNAIRNITPPGSYLMFISNTSVFDPTADYRVLTSDGSGNLETNYDFDGTKYITFGYAPEVVVERSVYFDGAVDYIDMEDALDLNTTDFTISSWVKRGSGSANTSILSKRDAAYTEGYDYKINAAGRFEMSWKNGSTQTITSDVVIPENQWHHVAIIYSGGTANLYIDGVLDKTASLTAPVDTTQSFYIAAAGKSTPTAHFEGNIDEVRVWDTALTADQLRYVMNQEIIENATFTDGVFVPTSISKNDVSTIPWTNLAGYYPMSVYTYTNTNDESGNSNQGALRNLNTVDYQTAPLPYTSTQNGNWDTSSTWLNGSEQTIPGATSIVDSNTTVDWNIVETNHNLTMDNSSLPGVKNNDRHVLGFILGSNTVTLDGDSSANTGNAVTVTHYLKIDGTLDLEGESQLIQTEGSDLAVSSSGQIERDQQGTENSYTYNYWSAPVSLTGAGTNNTPFTIADILKDGTNPANPLTPNFAYSHTHADGALSTPRKIATYWIWNFVNQGNAYANWNWIGDGNNLNVTEGYTMKGTSNTGAISDDQNFVFIGKPNNVLNGNTELIHTTFGVPADPANPEVSLTGNPFPSAIDADQFIADNLTSTNGQLLFWEHWGGGSHNLGEYQGGYATRTIATGVPAASHPDIDQTGTGSKSPGQFVAVAQGFFITSSAAGGNVVFKNSQRVFEKEGGASSVFFRGASTKNTSDDTDRSGLDKMVIRLGFESPNGYHRQIAAAFNIDGATDAIEKGYDGYASDILSNDAFFIQDDTYFVIQAYGDFNEEREIPIAITIDEDNDGGLQKVMIDELENIPSKVTIYIKDNLSGETHNLKNNTFEVSLSSGTYKDRFSIVFRSQSSLSVEEDEIIKNGILTYMNNPTSTIKIINNTDAEIQKVVLYNALGQQSKVWLKKLTDRELNLIVQNLSTGVYILKIETNKVNINKKLIIE